MSLDPSQTPDPLTLDVRAAARATSRTLSAGLMAAIAVGVALMVVLMVVVLDYRFHQQAHRLWKVIAGIGGLAAIFLIPRFGLMVIPVATPFLSWLPKLPIPAMNPLNILLFGVYGAWALPRMASRQRIFRGGHLSGVLLTLLVLSVASIIRAGVFPTGYQYNPIASSIDLIRSFLTFGIYFVGTAMLSGEKDRRRMAWAIVIGFLLESIITIAYGRSGRGGRAVGSIGQANELGAFLAMFGVLAVAMMFGVRHAFGRLVLAGSVVVGLIAELLTVSRAGLLAFAGGLFFVAIRSSRWLTLLLLAVGLSSPLWVPDYVKERVMSTTVESDYEDDAVFERSAQIRIYTWQTLMKVISDHPLDGVGFSALGYVLPEAGEGLNLDVMDSSHNTYLRFLAEMGILGLVVLVWLFWKCWTLAMKGMRLARNPMDRQIALGLAASTAVIALSCAFGDRLFSILVTGNFWMLCAIVDDMVQEAEKNPPPPKPPARRGRV